MVPPSGAKRRPKEARNNGLRVHTKFGLGMPILVWRPHSSNFWCEHHSLVAQTMLKICPNLSFIVEILITRLMSRWRRDITVDRGVSPVLRNNAHTVVFTGPFWALDLE